MKTLLRDLATGLLFHQPGTWVENCTQATDFGDAEAVCKQAATLGKMNLEVLVVKDNGSSVWGTRIANSTS